MSRNIGLGFKQQKDTGYLLCDCGGCSFYINPNGSSKGIISFCCAKCKESCGKIVIKRDKLEIVSTEFASLNSFSTIIIKSPGDTNGPYRWVENGSSHNKRVTARKPRLKSPKKATS